MKIYLMLRKQECIKRECIKKRNGVFKPKEVIPFLKSVIKEQNMILTKIKNSGCN